MADDDLSVVSEVDYRVAWSLAGRLRSTTAGQIVQHGAQLLEAGFRCAKGQQDLAELMEKNENVAPLRCNRDLGDLAQKDRIQLRQARRFAEDASNRNRLNGVRQAPPHNREI